MNRRDFLRLTGHAALSIPATIGLTRRAHAQVGPARRLIVFYFPDGVPAGSQDGQPSAWHPAGEGADFALPDVLAPLAPFRDQCAFFRGLQMGGTDEGSHPGGAKKLLTAADGGNGESIDRALARTVGAMRPHRHVYLGAMANHNNASGDKHISYVGPGTTVPPEDDPVRAFQRLFGAVQPGGPAPDQNANKRRVLETIAADLRDLRGRLVGSERRKLDLHLDALDEVERRIESVAELPRDQCADPPRSVDAVRADRLYEAEHFPQVLAAQRDVLVQAMACGLTQVGVIQASHHTSELIMSRFAGTPLHTPDFDMRSHQASHYGPRHDLEHREYREYVAQRRWFASEFAALLQSLRDRPEGDGNMLDYSLVLMCSEVSDGNVHDHRDMPFVLAGGGGGALQTGRLLNTGDAPHGRLLLSVARAMGAGFDRFGQTGDQPLRGI